MKTTCPLPKQRIQVRAVVHQPCNFTVSLGAWQGEDSLEVFWLSSGVYVEPRDPQGARLVFTKAGPANQTVHLQAAYRF